MERFPFKETVRKKKKKNLVYLLRHSWRIWYGESRPALLVSSYTRESSILIWLKYCRTETEQQLGEMQKRSSHSQGRDFFRNNLLYLSKWAEKVFEVVKLVRRRTSSSSPSTGFSSEVCFTKSGMRISSVARAEEHSRFTGECITVATVARAKCSTSILLTTGCRFSSLRCTG